MSIRTDMNNSLHSAAATTHRISHRMHDGAPKATALPLESLAGFAIQCVNAV
jgi:hypothetical protein